MNTELQSVKECSEENIETMVRRIETVAGSAIDVACGQTLENDSCEKMVVPKRKKNQRKPKSILIGLIDVMGSIKDY